MIAAPEVDQMMQFAGRQTCKSGVADSLSANLVQRATAPAAKSCGCDTCGTRRDAGSDRDTDRSTGAFSIRILPAQSRGVDLSGVPVRNATPAKPKLAPNLSLGRPDAAAEREADHIAERVMSERPPREAAPGFAAISGRRLQARSVAGGGVEAGALPPAIVHDVLRAPGRTLDAATRAFMELRFGREFGDVRVHTGEQAARSAKSVGALAFTIGHNVVFGDGRYTPGTQEGRSLLAHELAHVMQQDGSPQMLQRACDRTVLSEGTCQYLTTHSRFICCDPTNGISRPERSADIDGTPCPSRKFTPIFTCDANCTNALAKGCSDTDNWMAIPGDQFNRSRCNTVYTICANGRQTTGYVRDRSVTAGSYEVSPGIQTALGVTVGSSFMGAVYRPGASTAVIARDTCCHTATPAPQKPAPQTPAPH